MSCSAARCTPDSLIDSSRDSVTQITGIATTPNTIRRVCQCDGMRVDVSPSFDSMTAMTREMHEELFS